MSSPANKPPQTASLKPQRLPAPHLFVGPPSHNASNNSLLLPSTKDSASRPAISRQHSLLGEAPRTSHTTTTPKDRNDASSSTPEPTLPTEHQNSSPVQLQDTALFSRDRSKAGPTPQKAQEAPNQRVEALWAEMQSTLAEVELSASASGGGMNAVFGAGHSKALEGLRVAQVGLAKAWARSEGEEEREGAVDGKAKARLTQADVMAPDRVAVVGGGLELGRRRSGTAGSGKSLLEEETEMDIALAKKRREANDRYFQRVNQGVLDVVAKLEEVAKAMKAVELESREIWDDRDSMEDDV